MPRHRKESKVQRIVRLVAKGFPQFSRSDIEQVVRFTIVKRSEIERKLRDTGDDMRDYMNLSPELIRLSYKSLSEIVNMKSANIRRCLKEKAYPFSSLTQVNHAILLSIPTSWVRGAAKWLLDIKSN